VFAKEKNIISLESDEVPKEVLRTPSEGAELERIFKERLGIHKIFRGTKP